MICQTCRLPTTGILCPKCVRSLAPAPDRLLNDGVRLVAAFEHAGTARTMVHHLKYRGLTGFADLAALRIASQIPRLPVIPIPRSLTRKLKYGVDPAREIATRVGELIGTPVLDLLRAPPHSRRRAGGDHRRRPRGFYLRKPPQGQVILVDDVVTTGATLNAAIRVLGAKKVAIAVSGNAASEVSSLPSDLPIPP